MLICPQQQGTSSPASAVPRLQTTRLSGSWLKVAILSPKPLCEELASVLFAADVNFIDCSDKGSPGSVADLY